LSEVVSKGEFARIINVTPGRVSQMIAEGKIDAAALEGVGRFAKIRVDIARRQVADRTDIGQRFGNGLETQLEFSAPARPSEAQPPRASSDPVAEAIKNERLRGLVLANERAAEERLAERGRYVLADATVAGYTRLAATMLNLFEGGLADMANGLSGQFNLPSRDVLHRLRADFRAIRAKAAETLRREAEALPALLEDVVADASDPAAGDA
jgi:hypothetical protein